MGRRKLSVAFMEHVPPHVASAIFAVMAVTGQVGENITLPLLSDAISVGSDPYFVLFFGSAFLAVFFHAWLLLLRLCSSSINLRNTQLPHLQMFYVGLCTSLNGLLVVYASPTSRTSAFLQALLYNFTIPMTIGFRYVILRKAMTWKQAACAMVVMAGIFVALIPNMFLSSDDQKSSGASGAARILWPLCFMVGFAPGAIWNVLQERNLKDDDTVEPMVDVDVRGSLHPMHRTTSTASGPEHPPAMEVERLGNGYGGTLPRDSDARKPAKIADAPAPKEELPAQVSLIYFLAWTNTYMLVVSALLFWTDFLPQFGMASDAADFWQRFSWGFKCIALVEQGCNNAIALSRVLSFGLCYVLALVGSGLLVRHSDGANYLALVQTLTTPIGVLFWTLFVPTPLSWDPTFTTTTWFSLGGLCLMIPGIVYYNNEDKLPCGTGPADDQDKAGDVESRLPNTDMHTTSNGHVGDADAGAPLLQ